MRITSFRSAEGEERLVLATFHQLGDLLVKRRTEGEQRQVG